MIVKLIPVVLALVFSGPLFAQGTGDFDAGPRKVFEYGPRPPLSVFDPNGFLDPAQVKAVSDPLAAFYQKEGIDVIVVVVPDLGNAPPEHVAPGDGSRQGGAQLLERPGGGGAPDEDIAEILEDGFALGLAREERGGAPMAGSAGDYFWPGAFATRAAMSASASGCSEETSYDSAGSFSMSTSKAQSLRPGASRTPSYAR